MSPELIAPHRFGLKNSRPTKPSDCYAFGMVIYETISGHLPFHEDTDLTVSVKVLEGKRPPRGAGFTKALWTMMEQCWTSQSHDRPSIEDVLRCLETSSHSSEPLSPEVDEGMETDSGSEHTFSRSSSAYSIDLQDQVSRFRLRGSTVSSYPNLHRHPLPFLPGHPDSIPRSGVLPPFPLTNLGTPLAPRLPYPAPHQPTPPNQLYRHQHIPERGRSGGPIRWRKGVRSFLSKSSPPPIRLEQVSTRTSASLDTIYDSRIRSHECLGSSQLLRAGFFHSVDCQLNTTLPLPQPAPSIADSLYFCSRFR